MAVRTSRGTVLAVLCVGYFLVLLDVTIVNVALPRIGQAVGPANDVADDIAALQWVVDGYALALAALLLGSGAVGDRYGHRRIVLTGLALFGLASAGCGLAPTIDVLVAARVLQGVGAALLLPGTLAIISRAFPSPGELARAIGVWAAVGSVALPAGPLLGGLLVATLGWRSVFLVNVPIVLVAGLVAARVAPRDGGAGPQPHGSRGARAGAGRPDWAGTALAALFLASATFGVVEVGRTGMTATIAVAAAVATLALVGLLRVEATVADPMLPLRLFRGSAFRTANAVAGVMNLGTLGLLFLLTLFVQTVQQRSALAGGAAVLPLALPLCLLAPLAGRVTARHGPRPAMVAGLGLAAVGVGLLTTWQVATPYAALVPAMLVWGVGLGLLTPAVVAAAVGAVPPEHAGLASGVNNTARQAGGAIGVAAYGAVAGSTADPTRFLAGLHLAALVTAGLFLVGAVAAATLVPSRAQAAGGTATGFR